MKVRFGMAFLMIVFTFGLVVAQNGTTSATMGTTAGANNAAAAPGPNTRGAGNPAGSTMSGTTQNQPVTSQTLGTVTFNNTIATNSVATNNTIAINSVAPNNTVTAVTGVNQNFNSPNTMLTGSGMNGLNQNFNTFTDVNGQNVRNNQVTPVISPFVSTTNPFINGATVLNPFANPFNTGIVNVNPAFTNQLITASTNPNFPLNVPKITAVIANQNTQTSTRNFNTSIPSGRAMSAGSPNASGTVHFQSLTLGSTGSSVRRGIPSAVIQLPFHLMNNSSTMSAHGIVRKSDGTFTNVHPE